MSDAYDVIPLMVSDRLFDVNESHVGEKIMAKGSSDPTTSMRRQRTDLYYLCL